MANKLKVDPNDPQNLKAAREVGIKDYILPYTGDQVYKLLQTVENGESGGGATPEQIAQIDKNKTDIDTLQTSKLDTNKLATINNQRLDQGGNITIDSGASSEQIAQIETNKNDIADLKANQYNPFSGFAGKKVSILGDSISTFNGTMPEKYPAWYPKGDIQNVEQTWWKQVINATGLTLLKNCAWSGSKASGNSVGSNAMTGCGNVRIADLADGNIKPDIILVFIGINDFATTPLGTWDSSAEVQDGNITEYAPALALMLQKIEKSYPDAEIYVSTLLECSKEDGHHSGYDATSLVLWNDEIRKIVNGFGCKLIDLHSCGITFFNSTAYTVDGLHPNAKGAKLLAHEFINKLYNLSRYSHDLSANDEPTEGWYIDYTKSDVNNKIGAVYASYAYKEDQVAKAVGNNPINTFGFNVKKQGTVNYGTMSASGKTKLGTINLRLEDVGKQAKYKVPEFKLNQNETIWIMDAEDTASFGFGKVQGDEPIQGFYSKIKSGGYSGAFSNTVDLLGVSIGYFK